MEPAKLWYLLTSTTLIIYPLHMADSKGIIHLGAIFRMHKYDHFGYRTAVEFALEQINQRTDILKDYEIKAHFCDSWGDIGFAIKCLYKLVHQPPTKLLLLGPETSQMVVPVASAADLWNLVQISSAAYDANFADAIHNRLQYLTRNVPDFTALNKARLQLLKTFNWKRVALLYEYDEPTTNEVVEDMKTKLSQASIEVVTMAGFGQHDNTTLITALDRLQDLKVRVIIGNFGVMSLRSLFCQVYLRHLDISKFVWILLDRYDPGWTKRKQNDIPCTAEMLIQASQGFFAVKRSLLRKENIITVANMTAAEYQAGYIKRSRENGKRSDHWTVPAVIFDGTWAAALALNKSVSMNFSKFHYRDFSRASILNRNLRSLNFEGVTGPQKFNKKFSLLGCVSISQQRQGALTEIATFCEEDETITFYNTTLKDIFKGGVIPRDRVITVYEISKYSMTTTTALIMVSIIGIIITVFFCYVNFKYKEERCIQASSPRLNVLILVGGLLMYICAILFGLDTQYISVDAYPAICLTQTWILCCAFTLTFGAMFSKTWRVFRIFTASKSLRRIGNVSDSRLVTMVLAFLLVDVFVLITWTVVSPINVKHTDLIPKEIPALDRIVIPRIVYCTCQYQDEFIFTIYAYKGVLLLFGLFLAWETRNVHIKDLNDSKYIGMSVYNVVIFAAVGVMSSRLLDKSEHYEISYLIQTLAVFLCTTAVLFCLYIPKIIAIRNLDKNTPWLVSRTTVCTFVSENNSTTRPLYIATDVIDRGTQTFLEADTDKLTLSSGNGFKNKKQKSVEEEDDGTRRLNLLVIKGRTKNTYFPDSRRESVSSYLDTDILEDEKTVKDSSAHEGVKSEPAFPEDVKRDSLFSMELGTRRKSASFIVDPGTNLFNGHSNQLLFPSCSYCQSFRSTSQHTSGLQFLGQRRHSQLIIPSASEGSSLSLHSSKRNTLL